MRVDVGLNGGMIRLMFAHERDPRDDRADCRLSSLHLTLLPLSNMGKMYDHNSSAEEPAGSPTGSK